MDEHRVTSHFQQVLCPDPHHEVCNRTTEEFLWRQTKTSMTFQTLETMKEENGPFSGQKKSEDHLKSSWNSMHSLDAKQATTVSKTGLKIKGKPELLEISDQLLYVKTPVGDLEQKYSQPFGGLPCLQSESIVNTLVVSRSSYPLENHLVLFNGVYNAPAVQMQDTESPPPTQQFHPFPLTFVYPPSFPYVEPDSHSLPAFQVHSQAYMKCPSSFPSYRNTFHSTQTRPGSDILSENQLLECHVLQDGEHSFWALVPKCHQYHEAFYPSAPHFPFVRQPSRDYVPVSVIQENLEPQEPHCLILPQCFQSCCDPGQLVVMEHHCHTVDTVPYNCVCADSQPLEHWGHSCEDQRKEAFSQAGSFCEEVSTRSWLRTDVAKNLGYILGKCSLNDPPMISECFMLNNVRAEPETRRGWVCHSRIAPGHEPPSVSRKTLEEDQMKSILRLHVSRKFWQITAGRIPIKVCRSWLADEDTMPPGKKQNNMEKRNLSPLRGRIYCCIPTLEPSFLDHKTQQFLENHIIRYRVTQRWGFPLKVLESIKLYMLREVKPWPFPQSDSPSSFTHISSVDLKTRLPQPLRGSTKCFQEVKEGAINSVSVPDHPPPATSFADKEGEGFLRQSHSDGGHEVTETAWKSEDGRQVFLNLTDSKGSQSNTVLENQHSQEKSRKQDVATSGSGEEMVNSSHTVDMHQGNQMVEKNSEHCSTSSVSREIIMAHELGVLPSESDATGKLESSQMTNVNVSKVDTIWAPEWDPPRISVPKDPTLSEFKRRLLLELRLRLQSRLQSQAECSVSGTSFSSDYLTSDSLLASSSSEDMVAFQELHAHLDDTGIFMEPWPDPPAFKHVLWTCQDKNCTAPKRGLIPLGPKREKGRHVDSRQEISGAVRRSHPAKKGKLIQEPSPPESYFRKKMSHLFQWLSSPRENRGPRFHEKEKALFMSCGPPEAHELMASLGKLLEEKLVYGQKLESLEWSQGKKDMQMQPEPSPRAASNPQQEGFNPCFCSQAAMSPALNHSLSFGWNRDRIRYPDKIVAFKK